LRGGNGPQQRPGAGTMLQITAQRNGRVAVSFSAQEMPFNPFLVEPKAECMECRATFQTLPLGFIYDDPAAGWRQDPDAPFVAGYCKPCATVLADLHHQDYVNGNWERRTLEDEAFVWDR
jgi:hypothetical protein